jgi:hypothetical protein
MSGRGAMQRRGAMVMGVNQYTSTHIFEPPADGGRIALLRNEADSAGVAPIRQHRALIAERFAAGDFRLPGVVHARTVPGTEPGTDVMAARRGAIQYRVELLPRAAARRLATTDSVAIAAIHDFLAFQRQDHHAAAHADT